MSCSRRYGLRKEYLPSKWNESKLTLIHKGGHKSKKELKNYRPIALTDTVAKIFCGILNSRLSECFERCKVLGEEQNGFRKDGRGEDNMFVVNEIIESRRKNGRHAYFVFLDIGKAYDTVNPRLLCRVLEKVGMSSKLLKLIRSMYENTRARYSLGDKNRLGRE